MTREPRSDHSPFPPAIAEARARGGKALRDLGHALVGHDAPADTIDELTADLDAWSERLATGTVRDRVIERPTGDWGPPPPDGEEMFSFDERPVSGRSSPYGLDLTVVRDGDEVVGRLTLGAAHEGAPGRSHGGIVSALFDDVFGFVLTLLGEPAFTGELKIRYEQGVPLHVPLECRVRMSGRERRKIFMTGELTSADTAGDRVVHTRAEATFIAIDPANFGSGAIPGA